MKIRTLLTATVACAALTISAANAATILGTGTAALLGGDLTDPENDGSPDADVGYNATFNGNNEPGFGAGEAAFNIWDNRLGGGNDKWCCGTNPKTMPLWVSATFASPIILTHFTASSSNDSAPRDPIDWQIQGTNDADPFTAAWTTIHDNPSGSVWTARNQVVRFDGAGADFATPAAYTTIRWITNDTAEGGNANHALNEVELFGTVVPEPSSFALVGLAGLGLVLRRRR